MSCSRGQQLDQTAEDFVAILAVEREGELRGQQTVTRADVVAATLHFVGEVALPRGDFRERRAELNATVTRRATDIFAEQRHHLRRQHVHSEEAKIDRKS